MSLGLHRLKVRELDGEGLGDWSTSTQRKVVKGLCERGGGDWDTPVQAMGVCAWLLLSGYQCAMVIW